MGNREGIFKGNMVTEDGKLGIFQTFDENALR